MFVYLQGADECLVFLFNDCSYFSLWLTAFHTSRNSELDAVAVQRMHGVAFGNVYFFAVGIGDDAVLAVASADEYALGAGGAAGSLVFPRSCLDNGSVESQFRQIKSHGPLCGIVGLADGRRYLLVVIRACLRGDEAVDIGFDRLGSRLACFSSLGHGFNLDAQGSAGGEKELKKAAALIHLYIYNAPRL